MNQTLRKIGVNMREKSDTDFDDFITGCDRGNLINLVYEFKALLDAFAECAVFDVKMAGTKFVGVKGNNFHKVYEKYLTIKQ